MATQLEKRNWQNIRGILQRMNALRDTRCRVYHNIAQSINSGTYTTLTFNSERFDPNGMHNLGVNPSRITFTAAGTPLIGAGIRWQGNADGNRYILLWLNGTTYIAAAMQMSMAAGWYTHQNVNCIYEVAAGDFVEVRVRQTSGVALNIERVQATSPEFWVKWFE